jgi:hypothetical protein
MPTQTSPIPPPLPPTRTSPPSPPGHVLSSPNLYVVFSFGDVQGTCDFITGAYASCFVIFKKPFVARSCELLFSSLGWRMVSVVVFLCLCLSCAFCASSFTLFCTLSFHSSFFVFVFCWARCVSCFDVVVFVFCLVLLRCTAGPPC